MDQSFISKLFLVVLLCAVILLFRLFWTYVSSIVLALLIASAFYPLYSWFREKLKGREHSASLLMSLLVLLVLIIPLGGFVGTLSNEVYDFYSRTSSSEPLQKVQQWLESDSRGAQRVRQFGSLVNIQINSETIVDLADAVRNNVLLFLYRKLRSYASNMVSFLIHFFLMMMTIYYIFRDGARLKNYISDLVPFPLGQQELVVNKFREMGRAVIFGNGMSGIIQGILGGFGFFFFGLGSPFLWGTAIGFMAFLPIIGAYVIFIPATIILLIQDNIGMAIGFMAYNVGYASIIEYVIKPRLIGKGMRMNPLLVFIGILGGLKLFGLLGIIYGPLIMTIFLTLAEIYKLEYKETSA
jgi:predicted PurR-regulated permease PerM